MTIPGYAKNNVDLRPSPITSAQFDDLKTTVLFGDDDIAALRRSAPILEPVVEDVLDVWYGFVGSQPFLVEHFSHPETKEPSADYLGRVRARFGQWIRDTAEANYDEQWLRWQFEIGRRHHRVGKNQTDGATSSAVVPFRFLFLLLEPVVHTLRPFLERTGESAAAVDAMQAAWRKSVLLQLTLWSFPYVGTDDF